MNAGLTYSYVRTHPGKPTCTERIWDGHGYPSLPVSTGRPLLASNILHEILRMGENQANDICLMGACNFRSRNINTKTAHKYYLFGSDVFGTISHRESVDVVHQVGLRYFRYKLK